MNKLTVAAVAFAAIGLASTAASAQTVSVGSGQDLILGFQLGTSPTDLEVDLGSYTLFNNATPGSVTNLSSLLSATDLATLTASWNSTTSGTGVNWSVAGITTTSSTPNANFDVTSTTGIKSSSQSTLVTPYGIIAQLAGGLNGQPKASTTSSALIGSATTPANTISSSYTSLENGNGYGFVPSAEQVGVGSDELYSFTPQTKSVGTGKNATYPSAIDLGTFSLTDNSGVAGLTFTASAAAVPEPSAYALGICAGLLFLVLKRRHSVA